MVRDVDTNRSCLVALGFAFSTIAIGACANGAETEASLDSLSTAPIDSGAPEPIESKPIPQPPKTSSLDAGVTDAAADAATDASQKADAATGGQDASVGVECDAPAPCSGATNLGNVSGDVGTDTKKAEGHTSQWFTVRVTENDQALVGRQLWMTATLVSPPGTNFDVFLYVPSGDTKECSLVSSHSTKAGNIDTAKVQFGEMSVVATVPLDDRTVTVEVRHVSGACDPSKKWKLEIAGNK